MGRNVRSLVDFILHQANPIRFVCWCCSLRFFSEGNFLSRTDFMRRYMFWNKTGNRIFTYISEMRGPILKSKKGKIVVICSCHPCKIDQNNQTCFDETFYLLLKSYRSHHIVIHDHSSPIAGPTNTFSSPKWGCFRGQDCHCRTHWYRKDGQKQGANMTEQEIASDYPPGSQHIPSQPALLSRWFSELPQMGYVKFCGGFSSLAMNLCKIWLVFWLVLLFWYEHLCFTFGASKQHRLIRDLTHFKLRSNL